MRSTTQNQLLGCARPRTNAFVLGFFVFSLTLSLGQAAARAQEISGLQAAVILEDVLVKAIERSEESIVSIARFHPDEMAIRDFRPELIPRPGFPALEPTPAAPTNPDFVPNDFATGVVIDKSGLIVTTFHAVDGPGEIWVTTTAKRPMRAEIRGADRRSDLAVLRVLDAPPNVEFKPITFGDVKNLKKGQIVVALGNPYAIARDGRASASWGIIANLSPRVRRTCKPPTPATANDATPLRHADSNRCEADLGTSGGALLNLKGEMIGLTTSQAAVAGFEQAAGYAVPVDETILRVLETLKQGKEVEYGLLGVSLRPLDTRDLARGLNGVRVDGVLNGSPAERAGLFPGDLITQVAQQPISDVDGLMLLVGKQPPPRELR